MYGNNYYKLVPDAGKNRIYFNVVGSPPSIQAIPNFESDWLKVMSLVKSGFTVLADMTEMGTFPDDVDKINKKVQADMMEKGCSKIAQIAKPEIVMKVNSHSNESGMRNILRGFFNKKNAELWLDGIMK